MRCLTCACTSRRDPSCKRLRITTYRLGEPLHHYQLRCRGADGIDVRSDHIDRGDLGAKVEWDDCSIRHANRRAFLRRAPRCCDSQRVVVSALGCWTSAGHLRPRDDLRRHRSAVGAPVDELSTGTGRLAVAYGLSARLLHCTHRCCDDALR